MLPPEALAGALENPQGPTAGADPAGMAGGAPGAPPAAPGGMDDAQAVAIMKKHNIGPDDLPIIAAAAGHIMQKMGGGGAPAPGGPPPGPPGPPMGPPGVA